MRVIGGSAGGRRLSVPAGTSVRPTADRVKEALFSILTSRLGTLSGLKILDLFAGSGNLGIEALSRGAAQAVFVEAQPSSLRAIRTNLLVTGFDRQAEVLAGDTLKMLQRLQQSQRSFDIAFIDPPYRETALLQTVLQALAVSALLAPCGIIAVETDKKTTPALADALTLLDRRIYGDTAIALIGSNN